MTEKLKSLMDEVSGMQDFASPDLDAIVRDGDRTVRRRRALLGAGGLVAAVAVGAAIVAGGGLGTNEAQVADTPVDSDGMSWSVGSVLHTPGSSIDLGHRIRAYVRTTAGFVTVDGEGRVWSVVGDEVDGIGRMQPSSLYLTSDTEDSLAAWLEPDDDGTWSWVVFDQAQGRRLATFQEGRAPEIVGVVVALDDRQLYVSQNGYKSLDVDDGTEAIVDRPVRAAQLLSVENGIFAWADPGNDDGESEYIVGRTEMEPVRIPAVMGSKAVFSPDGRWVSFDADEPRVFEVETGQQLETDLDDRSFATGYEWLDENTLVFLSFGDSEQFGLQVCDFPSGTCDTGPAMDGFGERSGFSLAAGEVIDDD